MGNLEERERERALTQAHVPAALLINFGLSHMTETGPPIKSSSERFLVWTSQSFINLLMQGGHGSVQLRFMHGTVRVVPVCSSDGSSLEGFLGTRKARFRFRFLINGSGGSGSFGSWKKGSDGSGFQFRFVGLLLRGLLRGAVYHHGSRARKEPIKQRTQVPTSTTLMGRFQSQWAVFLPMGRFPEFTLSAPLSL